MNANRGGMRKCSECASWLAHDQRYCLTCGARRGQLPSHIAQLIGVAMERGHRLVTPRVAETESEAGPFDAWLAAPRAAAVAVMGMLGFGVIVGSLVSESAASSPQTVVAVAPPHGQGTTSPAGSAASSSGGAGASGGGGTRTITVVSPAPAQPAAASAAQAAPGSANSSTSAASVPLASALPPVKHVFLIVLSEQGYNQTFADTASDPYLAKTLVNQGELVPNYYAVAGGPLANEIALISGQGPTPETTDNCPVYSDVTPGDWAAQGQFLGDGCVYPKFAPSLPSQLSEAHLTWKAYVETTAAGTAGRREACRHPTLGSPDSAPSSEDPYATWRNPFLYFRALIGDRCPKNDASLSQLAADLRSKSTTPALSYIVADVCHDGSDTPCGPGAPSGMPAAEPFLRQVVKEIKHSPAYKADGLIAITFDNAPQSGPNADPSSCCDSPAYPNVTAPTGPTGPTGETGPSGPTGALSGGQTNPTGGGGQVGLLLISKYVKPGNLDVTDYFNHFSLLASIERLFGLKRLGYATDALLPVFGPAVWTNYGG